MKTTVQLGQMKPGDRGVLTDSSGRRYKMQVSASTARPGEIEVLVVVEGANPPWTATLFSDSLVEIEVPDKAPTLDELFLGV